MVEDGKDERLDGEPNESDDPRRFPDLEPMSVIDAKLLAASDAGFDPDETFSNVALLRPQQDESDGNGVSVR